MAGTSLHIRADLYRTRKEKAVGKELEERGVADEKVKEICSSKVFHEYCDRYGSLLASENEKKTPWIFAKKSLIMEPRLWKGIPGAVPLFRGDDRRTPGKMAPTQPQTIARDFVEEVLGYSKGPKVLRSCGDNNPLLQSRAYPSAPAATGRCALLSLPPEVRLNIFRMMFDRPSIVSLVPPEEWNGRFNMDYRRWMVPTLFLVCKTFYDESRDLFYRQTCMKLRVEEDWVTDGLERLDLSLECPPVKMISSEMKRPELLLVRVLRHFRSFQISGAFSAKSVLGLDRIVWHLQNSHERDSTWTPTIAFDLNEGIWPYYQHVSNFEVKASACTSILKYHLTARNIRSEISLHLFPRGQERLNQIKYFNLGVAGHAQILLVLKSDGRSYITLEQGQSLPGMAASRWGPTLPLPRPGKFESGFKMYD